MTWPPLTDLLARLGAGRLVGNQPTSGRLLSDDDHRVELEALAQEAVRVARSCIGKGEEGGNNCGPWIESIGGKPGAEWCALFVGHAYAQAAADLRMELPFARSTGAKAIVRSMGKVGRMFTDPLDARAGDLVAWHRRTGPITWRGHVELVARVDADGIIHTVAGNVGTAPCKVRELVHDVRKERLFSFASLRR